MKPKSKTTKSYSPMTNIIFFGNGPLADYSKAVLEKKFNIIFHAKEKPTLKKLKPLKLLSQTLKLC